MEQAEEIQVGKVIHYFPKINVAIVEVKEGSVKIGDEIKIKGHTTDLIQKISSMQIEHDRIESAGPGQEVGIKVDKPVRANDLVFKKI